MKGSPELIALGASVVVLAFVAWRAGTFDDASLASASVAVGPEASVDPSTLAERVRYTDDFRIARPRRIEARLALTGSAPADVLVSLVERGTESVREGSESLEAGASRSVVFDGVPPGVYRLRLVATGGRAAHDPRARVHLDARASGGSRAALFAAIALLAAPLLAAHVFRRRRTEGSPGPGEM